MKRFNTMFKTELKLSLRGLDMVIFALIMPLVITIILGILFGNQPAFEGANYTFMEQSFGAVSSIAICAAGIMGLPLVVSDYRDKKILKRFKVTPINPSLILLVQVAVNMFYAILSLLLVYSAAAIFFGYRMRGSWLHFIGAYFLVILSMYSLGMMVGGIAPNIKTVNLVCSMLYFPMLIFSGTTLPYEIMPKALQKASDMLPLTQGIKLLKAASLGLPVNSIVIPIIIMIAIAAICISISIRFFRWE
ncbi:ABC transporter permease [Anaerocolumna sp. MB42-C2]|uniref:ABC transporter permease n=1 Tax=Anaerocolumna sp. MB42-C2 TaxID=3070997 RepID=UPI0027E06090|nr:ABC transporter permease [Anaerocolumna sp. MB42-C2]WMJ85341.1 ABC transporter permease [Anaerocolumna sp. MB42-C2]